MTCNKDAKESFTLHAYHVTLQNANCPLVGSTVQLWGYLFHFCAKDEELSTVFTTNGSLTARSEFVQVKFSHKFKQAQV